MKEGVTLRQLLITDLRFGRWVLIIVIMIIMLLLLLLANTNRMYMHSLHLHSKMTDHISPAGCIKTVLSNTPVSSL